MGRILLIVFVLAAAAVGVWAFTRSAAAGGETALLRASRGTVVKKAVAAGQVEPERETQVNTQLAGFVRKLHTTLGKKVEAGAPLAEVWPALTEQDLLRAERGLLQAREGEEAAREFVQGSHVLSYVTRWLQGGANVDRMQRQAERGRKAAEEQLALLREGKVQIDGRVVDFVVRAPVGGHVLQLVREGDPVTPASNYGVGTVLAVLGDLDRPVFRGTVDEIDVARLRQGMPARITLGAVPNVVLSGTVQEIGLRARRQDNAAVFDVRVVVSTQEGVMLRAGYSAVAEFELARAENVLVLPERCVSFFGDEARVNVRAQDGTNQVRRVELGLSDGLTVEIRAGLTEGEQIVDRR